MKFSLQSHQSFIGRPATDLSTPSLILSKPILNIDFRPHVKTPKSTEVTTMMLGNGTHRKIAVSTLAEIRGAVTLAKEGLLDEIARQYSVSKPPSQQALRVLTEVCSVYPGRNEALINAGTVALSKETSAKPGFGCVADRPDWAVVRMSQEHGILGFVGGCSASGEKVRRVFRVGWKVMLSCQHACITASAYFVY